MASAERSEANRVLAGRYRLVEQLGEGGMGTIWRAQHLVLNAPVAVKLIDRDVAEDDDTAARFMQEAMAAAALRSPHVVQIIDYGVDDHTPFIVMELLEGETLARRIKRLGRLAPPDMARIISHVARAVGRAHEAGIVHRDLKPENVFIVHNEDEEIAKVLDFGVAKVAETALGPNTRTGSLLGTPYYMSPEQAQGNKDVDFRSDLWSLAVIAFEAVTGKRPFYSDALGDLVLQICVRDIPTPSQIAPVPLGFDAWFARATDRDPDKRFQSAREMTDALREALGVDARLTTATFPEIVVQSGRSPEEKHEAEKRFVQQDRDAEARSQERLVPKTPRTHAVEAPTVVAEPSETADAPALTERQFSTTHRAHPAPRGGSSAIAVVGVAFAALTIGLVAGFAFLMFNKASDDPATRPLPAVQPQPEREPAVVAPSPPALPQTTPSIDPDETEPSDELDSLAEDAGIVGDGASTPREEKKPAEPAKEPKKVDYGEWEPPKDLLNDASAAPAPELPVEEPESL